MLSHHHCCVPAESVYFSEVSYTSPIIKTSSASEKYHTVVVPCAVGEVMAGQDDECIQPDLGDVGALGDA